MYYPIDTKFIIPRGEADIYRNMHHLLAAGEKVPLYLGGMVIGHAHSCTVHDNESYWAFDFNKMNIDKPINLNTSIEFLLNNPVDFEKYDLYLNPVYYKFLQDGEKFKFQLVLCFKASLVLKPMYIPKKDD